ncbi:helix-turn-helix domain-containing protein [Amycolatopsis sp. NPDC051903]|uniref:helix-turn-helix domain-containing protein n=1 Tax=Amycolatopsis sp. NPDC051903 TaxID=3363936 RepID=UPI0037A4BFF0
MEPTPAQIGARVRHVRKQRGMTQAVAAGLAGINQGYLARLERGERHFERRGLIETLAEVLGCSVTDLTGQPYQATSRDSAAALAALPPISRVLADATLDDVPDTVAPRPLAQLVGLAAEANAAAADSRYAIAGHDLAQLLLELHAHTARPRDTAARRVALAALVEACIVAVGTARTFGNLDLATLVAGRAQDAAAELEDPALGGFAAMSAAIVLTRFGARHRATRVTDTALAGLSRLDPDATDTAAAEAAGMLHLATAQRAAKNRDADTAATHLAEARALATRTGERTTLRYDFGPANVDAWDLSINVELGRGAEAADAITRRPGFGTGLASADRTAALHFDLARGFAQAGGVRDDLALKHLDLADVTAPLRIRHDPVAAELITALDARAQRRQWQLTSLKSRIQPHPAPAG